MENKAKKELIKSFSIEDVIFNLYAGTISKNLGNVLAFCDDNRKVINFTVFGWIDYEFLELYFRERLLIYRQIFQDLSLKGKHVKNWNESSTYYKVYNKYKYIKQRKQRISSIDKSISEQYEDRVPEKHEIEHIVRDEKGMSFHSVFVCKLCMRTHSSGYNYLIRGYEVNVCSYCRSEIRKTKNFVKFISTNMGHGKKG